MRSIEFTVNWHFHGTKEEECSYLQKANMYQEEFFKAYNKFCDITNGGLIDALNKEWDKVHPGEYCNSNNDRYINFMAHGFRLAVLRKGLRTKHITFDIGNEAELIGHLDCGGTLFFTLTQR